MGPTIELVTSSTSADGALCDPQDSCSPGASCAPDTVCSPDYDTGDCGPEHMCGPDVASCEPEA